MDTKVKQLAVKNITADPALQMRDRGTDPAVVEEYAEAMAGGAEFPPVVVYHDNTGTNWLSRGFHRLAAAEKAGIKSVTAEIRAGNRSDAILDAAGANATHGLKRTNADKRRAVRQVLAEFPDMPSTQIADIVGVSDHFVGSLRKRQSNQNHPIKSGANRQNDGDKNDARAAAAKKLDDEPDPTAVEDESSVVTVEHAGAPRATAVVTAIIKALHKVQAEFSGLYAGHFAQAVRNTATGYTACNFYDTGELIGHGFHGGIEFGIRKLSCDSIDHLLGFCGGLKLMLSRVEHEPTGEQEYQEHRRQIEEFNAMAPELSAKLRSDDDTVEI